MLPSPLIFSFAGDILVICFFYQKSVTLFYFLIVGCFAMKNMKIFIRNISMKVRPMKKNVLFPVMSYKILGSVGRQTFFFFFFFVQKMYKNL